MIYNFMLGFYRLFLRVLQPNRRYYYGRYYGTDTRWLLLLKNLLRPGRWLRIHYARLRVPKPKFAPSADVLSCAETLHREGIVFLPMRFTDVADSLPYAFRDYTAADAYQDNHYLNNLEGPLAAFLTNEYILQILALHYGCQPYVRAGVGIHVAVPPCDQPTTRSGEGDNLRFAWRWHFDYPNLVQCGVLLHDTTADDPHMQLVAESHRRAHRNLGPDDYNFSDEYVQAHGRMVPCIGPRGTAYLFDSNALHRLYMVKGRRRALAKLEYTAGNDISPVKHPGLDYEVVLDPRFVASLSPFQQEAVRPVMSGRRPF